jgi:hypothetical protein
MSTTTYHVQTGDGTHVAGKPSPKTAAGPGSPGFTKAQAESRQLECQRRARALGLKVRYEVVATDPS